MSSNNKLLIQYVELMRSLKIYVWNMLNYFFEGYLLENQLNKQINGQD